MHSSERNVVASLVGARGGVGARPVRTRLMSANLLICFFLAMLTACSGAAGSQPPMIHSTPTSAIAGGEPILPHSQIHFHDAILMRPLHSGIARWVPHC